MAVYLLFISNTSFGQNPEWMVYNTSNSGLPDNGVNSIVIDADGNKWIGTENGLAFFDGINWIEYNISDSGLVDDRILTTAMDGSGIIWIGTFYGGLASFDGTNWIVDFSGLPCGTVGLVAIDENDLIWIQSDDFMEGGGCYFASFDGTNWTLYDESNSGLPSDGVSSMAFDGSGTKWFGTDNGLASYDGTNWTVYNISNSELPNNVVTSLAIDTDGNKWIGTENGLAMFNGTNWTIYDTTNSGIYDNDIQLVAIDPNSNKWIVSGNWRGGLECELTSFDGANWTGYNTTNSGLPSDHVTSMVFDGNGDKWFGTDAGLAIHNESGVVSIKPEIDLIVGDYLLHQNHPNPFNPVSTIRYDLSQASAVSLVVHDILGREVTRLIDGNMEPGYHQIQWDSRDATGRQVPSGIYIARLVTRGYSKAIKMVLLK
jgi:ligand-binding sensor domain-containing protein